MRSQPHYLLSRYERVILSPLSFFYYGAALYYFWHRAWLLGGILVLLSFVVGAIGQALPHRKHETYSELAEGRSAFAGEFEGSITSEDSFALSKAAFSTAALVVLTVAIIEFHEGARWYWKLLTVVPGLPLFVVFSFLVAVGPKKLLGIARAKNTSDEAGA